MIHEKKRGLRQYVQRNSKIRVESEEGIGNSWEQLGESESFCRKGRKGPMGDDAVRMVAKYVFACRGEKSRAMEAGREVGSEKRPDWERAKKVRAVGKSTRVSSTGK